MTQSTKAECIPMASLSSHPSLLSTCLCSYSVPIPEHQHPPRAGGRGTAVCGGQETKPPPSPISNILTWLSSLICAELPSAQKHGLPYAYVWASQSHTPSLLTQEWIFASPLRPLPWAGFFLTCKLYRTNSRCFWHYRSQITFCFIYTMAFLISNHPD